MKHGQFCPIAKACEILGERWTLLVVRELLAGSTRYGELKRGLGSISPSVLSTRLKTLVDQGIVKQFPVPGENAQEYRLSESGKALYPIIEQLGLWGHRWTRSKFTRDELDVEFLMTDLRRNFKVDEFPANEGVVQFEFVDIPGRLKRWWLYVRRGEVELCVDPPGRTHDISIEGRHRTLTQLWMGELSYPEAKRSGVIFVGSKRFTRTVPAWLGQSSVVHWNDAKSP